MASFDCIDQWLKELKTNSSPDVKIFLIGNKLDLEENREVETEKGKKVQSDYDLDLFMESSAKDGRNTEYIFVQAAKLLYNDYIKYKIGNPLIGKSGLESKKSNKLSKTNDTNFANKEINTFIAGYIEKGGCDDDGINYLYYFRNCFTFIKRPGIEFNLLMTLPNSTGQCIIINNSPSLNLYDAKCTIKGESSCTEVNNTDFTVGEKEPETNIISDLNALYYFPKKLNL